MTLQRLLPFEDRPPTRSIDFACQQDVKLLVPIAHELLESAEAKGADGIAAASVRKVGIARGLLLASTEGRYLANLSRKVMIAAGFEIVGRGYVPRVGTEGGNEVALWGRRKVA